MSTVGVAAGTAANFTAVTQAQWIFVIALAGVSLLIVWFAGYVVWTTTWANRWYRRPRPADDGQRRQ